MRRWDYVNFMADDDQDRIKANYRGNYERLATIKRKYDRDNLFPPELEHQPVGTARIGTCRRSPSAAERAGTEAVCVPTARSLPLHAPVGPAIPGG